MPTPLPIRSVNHISHVTTRLDEAIAFYRDVLGFRPIRRPPFSFAGAWLYNYGVQIHLIAAENAAASAREIQTRAEHVAFHVDDLDAAERMLQERSIAYVENVVPGVNVRQLFFHDPDGHHIELGTYPGTNPLEA